jgi:glycosyltransferase involved in cell wall biosynthesis
LVLVEAMACGTPIVTCPVGGVPEVVSEPRNALFVPPRDPERLSAALLKIIADGALRDSMSRFGPIDAAAFETKGVLQRLRAIYRIVLEQDPARG